MERDLFSSKRTVFTSGYEGKNIDEFLSNLMDNNIQTLVDVREIPLSRKKGFSKYALQKRLGEQNIKYVHIRALGSPSSLRKKLYGDKDYEYFFDKYEKHLKECKKELKELYSLINEKISCLLCFEKNPSSCHRSIVADKVSRLNGTTLSVRHI